MFLGSANHPFTLRHFFSYEERRYFTRKIFPDLRIVPLPDFPTNEEWFLALDDVLVAAGFDPGQVTFFGGCEEDVGFFIDSGRKVRIVNRFDGSTPKISATEVRDALNKERSLDGLVNPLIADEVRALFKTKWKKFEKI